MKYLSLIVVILSLSFCKSVNVEKTLVQKSETTEKDYIIQEKTEIIPKQIMHFTKDEAGIEYLKLLPGDKTVFRYSYKKKPQDQSLMDALYTENIIFEIPGKIKDMNLKDEELKSVNLTAQVFGFRNAKLIKIDKGSLQVKVIDKNNFEVEIILDDSYKSLQKKHIKKQISVQ